MTTDDQANQQGSGDGNTGGDGGDWRSNLPDQLVSAPYFRSADSLEAAIADITRAADTSGNSLRIPGPDADDAARAEFYQRIVEKAPGVMRAPDRDDPDAINAILSQLGKPAEANEYAFNQIEGHELSDERVGELKQFALQAGLTKAQFDAFMSQQLTKDAADMDQARAAHEAQIGELKGEWGAAYDQRMGKVAKMLEATGADPRLAAALADGTLSASDARWLHGVAERLGGGEGGPVGAQRKDEPEPIMTPDEALERLNELEKGRLGKFMPPEEQAIFTRKRMELMKLAMAGQQ